MPSNEVLCFIFFATFIVGDFYEALDLPLPPAIKPRQSSYTDHKWGISTLNQFLNEVLVSHANGTQIAVVGCAEWRGTLYRC